jgi:transglutaminase-like putative cysteine protease
VHQGQTITELVRQPQPSIEQLASAPSASGDMARWLALPSVPSYVTDLVTQITNGQQSAYARARAISDWFANPGNGFVYSLKTTKGDSGNDLVDFLQTRSGYCQQYAAAMGVMLRLAGVPSRVVLGYMHAAPDQNGNFKITTFDAHAWVEAYFPGSGWIPFDPTPTAGLTGGQKTDLSWAPHVYSSDSNGVPSRGNTAPRQERPSASAASASAAPIAQPTGTSSHGSLAWAGVTVLVLAGLALTPSATRLTRRRRRFAAARRGDPDALWAELSDTAVDLGYLWSDARSPRQVSAWLARDAAGAAPALDALAVAVEQRRYAPDGRSGDSAVLATGLQSVTDQLRSRRAGRTRLRARLWPASLGWGRRLGGVVTTLRRH